MSNPIEKQIEEKLKIHEDQLVTPWDVHGEVVDGKAQAINYEKLMKQFGCLPIDASLIDRLEKITGKPAHPLIKRGFVYCHRDFEQILTLHEQGKPFYLYTGRGPSSESMHLGHMIPFIFCKYLQDAFDCSLVIQLTDDEKFLVKDISIEDAERFAFENSKDIIAVGFNPEKTFIFTNYQYMGHMYKTVTQVQKLINNNQVRAVFGVDEFDNIGKTAFPAIQIAPSFSQSFPHIFGNNKLIPCLIPYAIDQDPYFRVCRDVAPRLKLLKPASLCTQFFPALQGLHAKMSASSESSAIYMTDTSAQIKTKINKYSFSGGGDTLELHRLHGAKLDVDVPFQYLRFFLDDQSDLDHIAEEYSKGRMMTGEVKVKCIQILSDFVASFQKRRAQVTDETVREFMSVRNMFKSPNKH
jgi:tryptophanyl-tRNA synthetase